jgi:hypothetical protein
MNRAKNRNNNNNNNNIDHIDSVILAANDAIVKIEYLSQSNALLSGISDIYKRYLKRIISIAEEIKENNDNAMIFDMVSTFMEFDSIRDENNFHASSALGDTYLNLRGLIYHLKDIIEINNDNIDIGNYSNTYWNDFISGKLKQLEKRQQSVLISIENSEEKYNKAAAERELKFNKINNSRLQEAIDSISSTQMNALKKITEKESELIKSTEVSLQKIDLLSQNTLSAFIHDTKSKSDTFKAEIEEIKNDFIQEMHREILQEIRIFAYARRRLNQLLDAAGNDVLAKDNLKQAETERKSANILRILGFIFLLFSVGYIAVEIGKLVSGSVPVTLELVLIRLIVTLVLMVPSVYLLKESARHRADERNFRKKGIHLATIDSYLANFDDASKVDMKKQLTANFFDNKDTVVDYSTITDMHSSLTKFFDTLAEKVKKEDPTSITTSAKPDSASTK